MFFTRERATEFLREQGIPVSDRTLGELAHRRTGPKYALIAGRALYRPDDIKAWLDKAASQEPNRRRA